MVSTREKNFMDYFKGRNDAFAEQQDSGDYYFKGANHGRDR